MKRPGSATVFGVINILFGGISLLGALSFWRMMHLDGFDDIPTFAAMETSATYSTWLSLTSILNVIALVVLIASGIGLLKMRRWARVAAVGYGLYSIFMVLASSVMGWFFVYSPMLDEMRTIQEPAREGVLMSSLFGALFGGCFGLIYAVVLLYFMTRPSLVAAFEDTVAPEPALSMSAPSPVVAASTPVLERPNPYAPPTAPLPDASEEVLATVIPFRNKPALISYYLGLFSLASLIPILGLVGVGMAIAALVLGIKGRRLAKENPKAKGIAHAWVGILGGAVWGCLGILVQGLVIAALVGQLVS
ncbi:MAG: hypothetical protein GY722_30090 [bacterium]|nr:hypothetical protein [bacterium]